MTDPQLEPLPKDIAEALVLESGERPLPIEKTSSLVARIEGTREFASATGSHGGARKGALELLRTRPGVVLFVAGTVWGLVLGALLVLLLR
jgi:hypothetical protein